MDACVSVGEVPYGLGSETAGKHDGFSGVAGLVFRWCEAYGESFIADCQGEPGRMGVHDFQIQ